jgi:predicted ATPase/DNA-binding CsgD family transcriptional regulator
MARVGRLQHNLPRQLSTFIGRDLECASMARLLWTTPLLTLVGPGGVGKTRLALHVAGALAEDFADGVWLIELGRVFDPVGVPHAVTQAVGAREQPGRPPIETLSDALSSSSALLVLDNCEHLIDACARLADDLLRSCVQLRILATSREPLGVAGEVLWRVPPLALPEPASTDPSDAVQLFVERAGATAPGFELTDDNRGAVVEICRRLDGLPLAIELAAARTRVLSPPEIANRLGERFDLLVGGSRTAPPRQQTLEATVNWSYDLLSVAEQRLFEHLAVFADGFTLAAVEAIEPSEGRTDVLDRLSQLVDRSLVTIEPSGLDSTRYRLLETMRAYAWERLVASGDAEQVQHRLANWIVLMAGQAASAFHGPEQVRWLRWAEGEHANITSALEWLIDRQEAVAAMGVVAGLWWSWFQHGRWHEGTRWFERCLALPGASARTAARARVLAAAGAVALVGGGDVPRGRHWLEEGLSIGLEVGDPVAIINARSLLNEVFASRAGPDIEQVEQRALELLDYARRVGNTWQENRVLVRLAGIALEHGDVESGRARLEQALNVARAADDGWSLAMTLVALGDLERSQDEHPRAGALYEESLAAFGAIGLAEHPRDRPYLLHNLGYVALAGGHLDRAANLFADALEGNLQAADRRGIAECLIGIGATAAAMGDAPRGVQLFAAGETRLAAANLELWPSNRRDYERWRRVATEILGGDAFERAWSTGALMSIEDALALARIGLPVTAKANRASLSSLTPRETDVARLVVSGLTNRQIGEALVITEKTAANHVQRILDKLGAHSRTQLAARSASLGLEPVDSGASPGE